MDRFASSKLQAVFGPDAGIYPLPHLDALRSNAPHVLDLEHLPGLVNMPSFHTACALLIAYCCRGIRFLNVLVDSVCRPSSSRPRRSWAGIISSI